MLRLEDGITKAMQARLISRKGMDKINDWDTLWSALFGDNVPVRDSGKFTVDYQRGFVDRIDRFQASFPR